VNGRRAGGVYRCWAAETERDHRHEQAVPECDVPAKVLRKMRERDGRIEDAV
jgi:hypothetical protein